MRSTFATLALIALAACGSSATESLEGAASAARVGPRDFEDPECMEPFMQEVIAIDDEFQRQIDQVRADYEQLLADLQRRGASRAELRAVFQEARAVVGDIKDARDATLAAFEEQVCGWECRPGDPNCPVSCDPNLDPDCPVCDPAVDGCGECVDAAGVPCPCGPDGECQEPVCADGDPNCCDPATGEDCGGVEPGCDPDDPNCCDPATGEDCGGTEPGCAEGDPNCCAADDPRCN